MYTEKYNQMIQENPVFLFMKGSPDIPACGFSRVVVMILNNLGVSFKSCDVLEDADFRQAIKELSAWPTFPQLYIEGELVGGCDIVKEMYSSGALQERVASLS